MGIKRKRIIRTSLYLLGLLVIFGLYLTNPVSAATTASVRWGYGTTSHTAEEFLEYDVVTDWIGAYTTGNYPAFPVEGLKPNTTYYYRVQIRNGDIITTSPNEEVFTTFAEITPTEPVITTPSLPKGDKVTGGGIGEDKLSGDSSTMKLMGSTWVGGSSGANSITDAFPLLLLGIAFALMMKNIGESGKGGVWLVVVAFILMVFAIIGVQVVQNVVSGL